VDSIQSIPSNGPAYVATSVLPTSLHDFIELVFQNDENTMQSWHLDGYDFWVVGYVIFSLFAFCFNQVYVL
jgi:iron transport multicopper oxidase